MWHPVKSEDCESKFWLMVAKKAAGGPWWKERRENLPDGLRAQLQKPKTGCIAAFLAILTAVLLKRGLKI